MGNLVWYARSVFPPMAAGRTGFGTRFWAVLLASIIGFTFALSGAAIAAGSGKAHRVKAAFVLNFAALTEWPSESFGDPKDSIVLCHVGGSQTNALLDSAYSGRIVELRSIDFRHLTSLERVSGCHIVFITAEQGEQARELITAVAGRSILTIGETEGFARSGGVSGFYNHESKIRFEITSALQSAQGFASVHDCYS